MSLAETLREHERAWNERPLVRRIYRDWFRLLASRLVERVLTPVLGKLAAFRCLVVLERTSARDADRARDPA